MGSGLILLVIVGAWLAVLVPVALRSRESSPQTTVEAFHDAMRVLSRRESPAPVVVGGAGESPTPTGRSVAARRRRVLLGLVVLALVTLVGAVLGPLWVLGVHVVADLLVVGYVGHLRHLTVLRRDRQRRDRRRVVVTESVEVAAASRVAARGDRRSTASPIEPAVAAASVRTTDAGAVVAAARRAQARGAAAVDVAARAQSRIAGVPDRMPSRVVVGTALYSLPVEETLDEVVEPARGAQGGAWSPVPVPLPAYLTAPVAPRRAPVAARSDDEASRHDERVERKRAVND